MTRLTTGASLASLSSRSFSLVSAPLDCTCENWRLKYSANSCGSMTANSSGAWKKYFSSDLMRASDLVDEAHENAALVLRELQRPAALYELQGELLRAFGQGA